jgi:2'-5' RNA ligase
MDEIRSFTAIELPPALKDEIGNYIRDLKKIQRGVKWVKAENLHITLKFIGEQSHALTANITETLGGIDFNSGKFTVTAAETGAFPNKRRPRVIWLGLNAEPPDSLLHLQSAIENKLETIGIEREKRPFSAHLTIGRVKFGDNFGRIWKYVEKYPFPPFSFDVESFALIKSILASQGAQYTVLKKYSLQ